MYTLETLHQSDLTLPITVVNQPEYSVYQLMRRWGFHQKASIMLPMDAPIFHVHGNDNATNVSIPFDCDVPVAILRGSHSIIDRLLDRPAYGDSAASPG